MCPRGKSFSCSAGLLLCFLHITLQQITCAVNNPQICSPSSCGKITNISYPFRLKDDPATCGDKRYELGCENNRTVLSLFSGKYFVQAINYNNYTIRLVDPAIHEADCSSIPRYSFSKSNFTTSYDYSYNEDPYRAPSEYNEVVYVVYLKCSNPVVDDPRYVDTAPCLNSHSKGHVYAFVGDLYPPDLKVGCSVKLVAPTSLFNHRNSYWREDMQNKTFSYAEIHRRLVYGFDLSWLSAATCEYFCGGQQSCYFYEENLKCFDDSCYTPLGFKVRCGKEDLSLCQLYATLIFPRWLPFLFLTFFNF
ncbi:Wall-associated receptor kinase, galacturonan-binding domain [Sesbania bispinosa]|nr:Wall-associated receptor kinase, galacturonan-binding domain [Sesbania bispinosa]